MLTFLILCYNLVMSKVSNVLRMLQLLNTGRKISIKQLSQELEVSERMIRQYKEELEMTGIFITTVRGPYGGYLLDNKFILPTVKITQNDILLLEQSNDKNLQPLLNKLKIVVNEYNKDNVDVSSKKFICFQKAIKNKQKVRIVYHSHNQENIERIIHPLDMLFFKNWFVVAFCELRQDIRSFEFENILSFELLDKNF